MSNRWTSLKYVDVVRRVVQPSTATSVVTKISGGIRTKLLQHQSSFFHLSSVHFTDCHSQTLHFLLFFFFLGRLLLKTTFPFFVGSILTNHGSFITIHRSHSSFWGPGTSFRFEAVPVVPVNNPSINPYTRGIFHRRTWKLDEIGNHAKYIRTIPAFIERINEHGI